ncbi:RSP_2648 family PIN domain-containing protein [Paracoccus zeaxanthinifaciens]|uniref:RSP_2648 family PIN domain-containing protein n=1 Tax=Paracoccus zeaxanthinifaciens TaxID=187400 RepID=UPI0003B65D8A|nr:PIN domain-containing protein [Paracoccus zeaxanthinifaciens]
MRALLDANVLFPTILREILTDLAAEGLYVPMWSDRILGEWSRAALRVGPVAAQIAGAEIALLRERFPDAVQPDNGDRAIDLDLPDPADRHVVEAALAGRADLIVTANLRDFPRPLMSRLGLRAIHPDAFLLDIHALDADALHRAVANARARAEAAGGAMSSAELLKRCRLPRLAKLMKV